MPLRDLNAELPRVHVLVRVFALFSPPLMSLTASNHSAWLCFESVRGSAIAVDGRQDGWRNCARHRNGHQVHPFGVGVVVGDIDGEFDGEVVGEEVGAMVGEAVGESVQPWHVNSHMSNQMPEGIPTRNGLCSRHRPSVNACRHSSLSQIS